MDFSKVSVEVRKQTGKGGARKVRASGKVPGVLYGHKAGPVLSGVGERPTLVTEQDAPEEGLVGQLVARSHGHRRLAAIGRGVEERGEPSLAGSTLAIEEQGRQGPARPAGDPDRSGLGAEEPGQVEQLGQRRPEGVRLVNDPLVGDRLRERRD